MDSEPLPPQRRLRDEVNFLLTNRVPRLALTRFMGWYSRIRSPWLTRFSIAVWRWFTPLDFSEAQADRFDSLRDCFTRALKPGLRPFDADPDVLCSPCDGIVGACGPIEGTRVWQAKGYPYTLEELLGSAQRAQQHAAGHFVTLRLTSAMYHRFHAPADLSIERVSYISGDTWNVNPIALARIERLFCQNERAVIETRWHHRGVPLTLVPVAAILVASIRLHALDVPGLLRDLGPGTVDVAHTHPRGEEMGWFEHGSTIIALVPPGFELAPGVATGRTLRAGEPLLRWVGAQA
jgi:phosphatidylserine decarboxylase